MIPFFSKRNQVYPIIRNDCIVVEKHFQNMRDWALERDLFETIQLPHPTLLEAGPGILVTEYCRYPTLLDELEAQEQEGFRPAPWESFAMWMIDCAMQNKKLPTEGNLRNFLWDTQHGILLGLDFENYRPIHIANSAATMIAALLEYDPPDTLVTQQAAELLSSRLSVSKDKIENARIGLRQRRLAHPVQPMSGIILAGGCSHRMGTDKAELMLGNKSLLEWQVQKLRALGIRDILISGAHSFLDTKTILDELPGRGPLGGIYSCLRAAKNERCLVLSVDTPLVPPSALYHLCRTHKGDVTVLCHGDFQEPLVGVYECKTVRVAYDILTAGSASVRSMEKRVNLSTFDYSGPKEFLMNCNTPYDFDKAQLTLTSYRARGVELL